MSQKMMMFSSIDLDKLCVKPKTKNPDRQKQCFPIKYTFSKIPGGRNTQDIQISILLGHPDQEKVNTIISHAKAYQRDPSFPPENPQNLSIGVKFSDPEIVNFIARFNDAFLNQLKTTGVTAMDPMRPDIPVAELDAHYKPPFTPTDDGGFVGYFHFTDDSLRKVPTARPSRMADFEEHPYAYNEETGKIRLLTKENRKIHYTEVVPQESYCMVVFSIGAMRLDTMSMSNKGARFPFIGSKLYLEKMILLRAKESEGVDASSESVADLLSQRIAVESEPAEEEEGGGKRFRSE